MGQTLTHGVYLPDEGERNCYSGLASNWSILDGAVGTIAEHTTQIAGKAPAVHTHGKSDITDLLNSNFIPSANNSYDLGSSSNQWNNLYAKNYFYNGTAWGLDKSNTWTAEQIIEQVTTATLKLRSTSIKAGDEVPSSLKTLGSLSFTGSDGTNMGFMDLRDSTLGNTFIRILARQKYDANGNRASNGSTYEAGIDLAVLNNRSSVLNPSYTGVMHLGTSTNKWKTLNGINPGALSIFNPSAATQDPIDIPNTWVTDGSAWNTLNVSDMGDGWICITYRLCGANDYILARFSGTSANVHPSMLFPATKLQDSKYYLYVLMPVAKAMGNIYLEIKLDSNAVLVKHSFMSAYGTV